MQRDGWDPGQYERFAELRAEPFFDLLALVERHEAMRVADLGCGTGKLTAVLHERLGARDTIGIDRSESMLAEARVAARSGIRFERGDIAAFAPDERFDLLFSNAALQWVPDHGELLARLTRALTERGQIAVHVPANDDHESHLVAAEVAREEPFRSALDSYVRESPVLPPEQYATLLHELSYARQHVRLQVYPIELEASHQVVEWVKGTLLTDYRARLGAPLYESFVERYRARLVERIGSGRPYFYPYKRVLFWGAR